MLNDVYSGYWTGDISGTNQGGISFTLNVEGNKVSGSAKIHELALGAYEYSISGKIDENLFIELTPGNRNPMVMLGKVTVICSLINNNKLRGNGDLALERKVYLMQKNLMNQN